MKAPSAPDRMLARRDIPRSTSAVSLVELMVVVTILSMMFMTAVPTYQQIQRKARASAIVNNFRVFAAVFQSYAHEKATWPPESAPGALPAGITTQDLQIDAWSHATPMGGQFDWENNQVHPGGTSPGGRWRAAIAITSTATAPLLIDADLMQLIDEELDDGNLETGSFRRGFGDCPLYIIEP